MAPISNDPATRPPPTTTTSPLTAADNGQPGATQPQNVRAAQAYTAAGDVPSPTYYAPARGGAPGSGLGPAAAGGGMTTGDGKAGAGGNDPAGTTLSLGSGTSLAQFTGFMDRQNGRPAVLTAHGGPFLVTGVTTVNDMPVAHTLNPNNPNSGGIDVPVGALLDQGGSLDRGQSGAGTALTPLGSASSQAAGAATQAAGAKTDSYQGMSVAPGTNEVSFAVKDAQGQQQTLSLSAFTTRYGNAGLQQALQASRSDAGSAASNIPNAASLLAKTAPVADSVGLGQGSAAQRDAFLSAQGDVPFLAAGKDGSWSVLSKQTDGTGYRAQPLGGGSASPVATADLGSKFTRLQTTAAAAGTQLKDADGKPWTFNGLARGSDGSAVVQLGGGTGEGRRGVDKDGRPTTVATSSDKTMALDDFGKQFGSAGVRDVGVAAQSTPTSASTDGGPSKVTWAPATGNLFDAAGSKPDDVRQGQLGDCYFAASMASVIAQDPGAMAKMVKPSSDGNPTHYDVTLHAADGSPRTITVDNRVPVSSQQSLYGLGAGSQTTNFAPALVEKAFAIFQQNESYAGSENPTGQSGYAGTESGQEYAALRTLTGKPASIMPVTSDNAEAMWTQLGRATGSNGQPGTPMTAASISPNASTGYVQGNVVGGHAYSVVSAQEDPYNHERTVTLRNPWGNQADGGNQVTMSYDDFRRNYARIASAGT